MGQKISDGKAFNLTVPGGSAVIDNELYRIGGINGLSIGAVATSDTARTLAFEADPAAVYSVYIPDALSPVAGAFLYWNDPTAFQYGRTNLKATPQHDGDIPCFFVTKAKNAANYVQGRILNGVTGAALLDVDQQAHIVALTDNSGGAAADGTIGVVTMPVDTPATADALRDDLVANALPEITAAIKELSTKQNAVIAALQTAGILAAS